MKVLYTKSYDKGLKELKKKRKTEILNNLDEIILLLKSIQIFDELKTNDIAALYGYEQLKYGLNEYYSCNLSKNKGIIRLLIQPKENHLEVY